MGTQFKIELNEKADDLRFDYSIPQVTVEQLQGIVKVIDLMHERLGIDKMIIRNILFRILVNEQIKLERFHLEMENDLTTTRFASKKNLEKQFIETFQELVVNKEDMKILKQTLEQMFNWYMKKYLKDK
ncbi:MAG: hypothetical protein HeimC2_14130 [Candidatus Heimdallarchaeota archaeon LC_2]|nr:MAG: hypothetical protein HeimC2_14130 [Candidatus Heimdallarchaeota archaeon LC_2]